MADRSWKASLWVFLAMSLCAFVCGAPGSSWAGKPPAANPKTLAFDPQPAATVAQDATWNAFSVKVLKSDGSLDKKNSKTVVTLTPVSLTSGATGTLGGTVSKTVTAGVATFTDVTYDRADRIAVRATASDGPLPAASSAVQVLAPAPASLAFDPQPASPVLQNATWNQFAVKVLKGDGSLDSTNNTSQVTLGLALTTGATGVLSGTLTRTVAGGVASFDDVSYDTAGFVGLTATTPDIPGYSKGSNYVNVLAPFAVTSVTPAEGSSNVPVTTNTVRVNFNRAVNASTVTPASFFITPNVSFGMGVGSNFATLSLNTPLANNQTYAVTVTGNVKDTYGFALASAKSWSFTTEAGAAAGWGTPVAISAGTLNNRPSYAGDGYGVGLAVWERSLSSSMTGMFSNRSIGPGQWQAFPGVLSSSNTGFTGAAVATVGRDAGDPMLAIWFSGPASPYPLRASQYTTYWSAPQVLGGAGYEGNGWADLDAGGGTAVAVWKKTNRVFASRWQSGSFGTPVTISATTDTTDSPTVCLDASGNAVAAWREHDTLQNYRIMANRFDVASGAWGAPQALRTFLSNQPNSSGTVSLVCDDFGDVTAAFHAPAPQSANLAPYAARFDHAFGTWQAAVQIGPEEGANFNADPVGLAVDADGAVLAVWSAYDGGFPGATILSNRRDAAGWGVAMTVHSSGFQHSYPTVAVDRSLSGSPAAAAWIDESSGSAQLYSSYLANQAGLVWGQPEAVSGAGVYYQQPQISVFNGGTVRAIWTEGAGTIYSRERNP